MQFQALGNSELIVSRMCLGMASKEMIAMALEAGINFFDTADHYCGGQSEIIFGESLKTVRGDVVIATKVGFRNDRGSLEAGLSRQNIIKSCEASLKRLNTDYIDLYIAHKEDPHTPIEETLDSFDALVRSGKVRYLGFSNWSAWKASMALQIQRANGWAQFINGQFYYSLLGRDVEHEIAPFMDFVGMGMTVWSPLAGGFLTGKYTPDNLHNPAHRYGLVDMFPFDKKAGFVLVDALGELAERYHSTVSQIALSWLLAKKIVCSIILGASKIEQLRENIRSIQLQLSDNDIAALDKITAISSIYPNWFKDRWGG